MRVIVTSIRPIDVPEEFAVGVLVDGMERLFRLRVVLPGMYSIETKDDDFYDTFRYSMASRKIAKLVILTYKGQPPALPIDLGDI